VNDDELLPIFMPALVVLLAHDERKKGSPLTREEVLAIRDSGTCAMLRRSSAQQIWAMRGYDDIDPERVWEEWQVVRSTLLESAEPTPWLSLSFEYGQRRGPA